MMRKTRAEKRKKDEVDETSTTAEAAEDGNKSSVDGTDSSEPRSTSATEEATQVESAGPTPGSDAGVAELQAKVEKLEDSLYRAKADFQNLQRRSAVEQAEAIRYANAELMKSLLPVLDDFERALAAANSSDNLEAVVAGVRLVYDNLSKALRAHGLEDIEALHRPFDPNVHEAMLQQPTKEHPPGTVVEQVARGYQLRERVIRPAKVIVSKADDAEQAEDGQTSVGDAGES